MPLKTGKSNAVISSNIADCKNPWSAEVTLRRVADEQDFTLRLCDDCSDYLEREIAKGEEN